LDLSLCWSITVDGIKHLYKLPLTTLKIDYGSLGDEGARALAAHPHLTTLKAAGISMGDKGAQALAENPRLTTLLVPYNPIGEIGIGALFASTTLKHST
jgi:hypothetical protein